MSAQLRAVDIHEWYRTGGIDWQRAYLEFDIVGIRAVVGDHVDELLEEHVDACKAMGIKYFTYCIPGIHEDPIWQADFYLDQYGVADGLVCGDVEPETKGGRLGGEYLYRKFFERLDQKRSDVAWYYSNYNNTKQLGNPGWIQGRPVFWGEYRYEYLTVKFRKFDNFLTKYPWWPPRWATALGISVMLHQFTDYGDARYYLANAKTLDPIYKDGIKSADLSVGLWEKADILALWDALQPPSEPDPDLEQIVEDHERRLQWLEGLHKDLLPPDPGPAPAPVPAPDLVEARVTDPDGTVAMGVSGRNDNQVPTIDINLYKQTGDLKYKFFENDIIQVHPTAVRGQGNTRWFRLPYELECYVDKDKVTKLE